MQTLMFNSTIKRVQLWDGLVGNSKLIQTFDNVPTVKVENGYYEVMQKLGENGGVVGGVVPVLRVPMANTNMFIER
jgi:hypothetical protein